MKIAIFLFEGLTVLDAVGPYESLARITDNQIVFVAKTAGAVRSGDGFLALHADVDIREVREADILIVPGGHRNGLMRTLTDPELLTWIRDIDMKSRWTCSVCTGSLILGAAGVLAGRKASTHWRAKDNLPRFGATYSSARVTIDGKYMTSAGVSAGVDMGLELCGLLAGRDIAEAIELSMQYQPRPPFGTGDAEAFATPERVRLIEEVLRQ